MIHAECIGRTEIPYKTLENHTKYKKTMDIISQYKKHTKINLKHPNRKTHKRVIGTSRERERGRDDKPAKTQTMKMC